MKPQIRKLLLLFACLVLISLLTPAGAAPSENEPTSDSSNTNRTIDGTTIFACSFGKDEADRLAKDGVIIGASSGPGYLNLEKGNVLLSPEKDLLVGIGKDQISIKSGASIFIIKSDDWAVVYGLCQTEPKQVLVTANKQKLIIQPGRMLVLTKQNTDVFEKLTANCHSVTYRNPQLIDLHSQEEKAFAADFSILSALVTIAPLKRLAVSSNREDQKDLERLLNGAGAGLVGNFNRQDFYLPKEFHLPPQFYLPQQNVRTH